MNSENINMDTEEMKALDKKFRDESLSSGHELKLNRVDINEESRNLADDEALLISKQKPKKAKAPYAYLAVGNGKKLQSKQSEKSIDLIKEMVDMTVNARRALDNLKDYMLANDHVFGIIKIKSSSWLKKEKTNWNQGISELISKDFVRREKRAHFIINPRLLVPTGDPTVEKQLNQQEKSKRHEEYIRNVLANWNKLKQINQI